MQDHIQPDVCELPSKTKIGQGLHTVHGAKEGELVLREFISAGNRLNHNTWDSLQIALTGEIDPYLLHPRIKLLNHSCDPSIRLQVTRLYIEGYALRDLEPEDELTFHYSTMDESQADGGLHCRCGAVNCIRSLEGYNGLTWAQRAELKDQFGKHILTRYHRDIIAYSHEIMASGSVSACESHIKAGGCTCCTFQQGNWIGIVPGEDLYLAKAGTMKGWERLKSGEGITCKRDPVTCDNKPLDCKLYPFFPYRVVECDTYFLVSLVAGDEKCSAKKELLENLRNQYTTVHNSTPFGQHLYRVGRVGVELHRAGFADWMDKTASGYVGYSQGYYVVVNKVEL